MPKSLAIAMFTYPLHNLCFRVAWAEGHRVGKPVIYWKMRNESHGKPPQVAFMNGNIAHKHLKKYVVADRQAQTTFPDKG